MDVSVPRRLEPAIERVEHSLVRVVLRPVVQPPPLALAIGVTLMALVMTPMAAALALASEPQYLPMSAAVAVVGLGPAGKKWRTFESAYAALAKSMTPVVVASAGATSATEPDSRDPRAAKRAQLKAKMATQPGWSLYETPNYFIVSCYDDKQFIVQHRPFVTTAKEPVPKSKKT